MPGLTVAYVVSEGEGMIVPKRDLDRDYLRQFIEPGSRCYLCGPEPMMTAVQGVLESLGVAKDDLVADNWT